MYVPSQPAVLLVLTVAFTCTVTPFRVFLPCDHRLQIPLFYREYVSEVQSIIDANARLEFEAINREHARTGLARSLITDALSKKITDMSARIEDNDTLWNNDALRNSVLRAAIPKVRCPRRSFPCTSFG
jgi:hypothetical protein